MAFRLSRKEVTPEMRRMVEKNSHNRKQLWEDGIKQEPRVLRERVRFGGKTLLRSSNVENDDEKHHHELLRHSGWKIRKIEPTMKRIWKILEKDIWLMTNHSYVKLWNEFENTPKKKSQVRSWEKTCGLGPTQKIHRWTIWRRDCTSWIKWLE